MPINIDDMLQVATVVSLPLVTRFRGITQREVMLFDAPGGQVEWSPFVEYQDREAAQWLRASLEEGWGDRVSPNRDSIRVNATVPAVTAEEVPGILALFPGVRTAKVKVAERGQTLEADLLRVAAVRGVLGAAGRVRVDANGSWDVDAAESALRALAEYGIEYAEQPCASIPELAELRRRLDGLVPIAADESVRKPEDPLEVVRAHAADVLVLKPQPLGGSARALKIVGEAGLPVVVSSALESSVGLAAAVRFAAALPQPIATSGVPSDLDHGLGTAALFSADVTPDPLKPVDGIIKVREIVCDQQLLRTLAATPERTSWWRDRLSRCFELLATV